MGSPCKKSLLTTVQAFLNLEKAEGREISQLMQNEAQGYNYLNSDACWPCLQLLSRAASLP